MDTRRTWASQSRPGPGRVALAAGGLIRVVGPEALPAGGIRPINIRNRRATPRVWVGVMNRFEYGAKMRVIAGGRNDTVGGVVAAVAVVGTLAALISDPGGPPVMGPMTITVATVVAVCCGAALAAVITVLSGGAASVGQWLRRTAAGLVLLVPAVVYVTWPFDAPGWDFARCGALIARDRLTEALNPDFHASCQAAAPDRLWKAVVWAAVACAAAAGYGLWLRRWRGVRVAGPPGRSG